jgi:uncharacterized protein YbaP (TraB family)
MTHAAAKIAIAEVPGSNPAVRAQGEDPVMDALAVNNALTACQAARSPDQTACELVRLNGASVATGAELRSLTPAHAYPLMLWRYETANVRVYLAGSIHAMKASLYPLPLPYLNAFDEADYLAMEVDVRRMDDPDLQGRVFQMGLLSNGQTLSSTLPADLLERTLPALTNLGLSLQQVDQFTPSMIATLLTQAQIETLGYHGRLGLEMHFLQRAPEITVLELETLESQLALLYDQPMEVQIDLLRQAVADVTTMPETLEALVSSWLTGDSNTLNSLLRRSSGASLAMQVFHHQLLQERNFNMAQVIEGYLDDSGVYFVLVGAAHLLGEDSIVDLLARKGHTGTQILSDGNPIEAHFTSTPNRPFKGENKHESSW